MNPLLTRIAMTSGAAAVSALVLAGCSDRGGDGATTVPPGTQATEASTNAPAETPTVIPSSTSAPGDELSVAEVVDLAEPSIVRIESGSGVGTGFLVSTDGYIVTNNHVVEGRGGVALPSVSVTLSDGEVVSAEIVGTDPRADLALLKIDGGPYQALALGDLDNVEIGQDVVAIGYALDLRQGEGPSFTVTRGIVSQKNRAISENAPILGAIQTDAAINHGNSGGPLLSLYGEVVGVNTALAPDPNSASGVAQGIGFAVGVDTVKAAWEQLRDNGAVNRGYLGISGFEALRPAQARDLGIPEGTGGIYLAGADSVLPGGPASDGGIQSGDVITRIGESAVASEADLAVAMIENGPGDTIPVEIYRGSEQMTVSVTLGSPTQ